MKKLLKILGIVFVAIIVLGVIGSSGSKTSNTGDTQKAESEQKQAVVQEPTKVKASDIADDFDSNQVAAEAKWKGKFVEFSSEITNITDSGLSFSKISSKDFSLTQISCRVPDKQQLMNVKNGQTVTVRGIVGDQTIGVIGVSDCTIVE